MKSAPELNRAVVHEYVSLAHDRHRRLPLISSLSHVGEMRTVDVPRATSVHEVDKDQLSLVFDRLLTNAER